jgi:hypothetical protein
MIIKKRVALLAILYIVGLMSVERKNPLKRDQALNDATSEQIGEEPGLNHPHQDHLLT